MSHTLTVCFWNNGRPFKRGSYMGYLWRALEKRGIKAVFDDADQEPDIYVFERTRHDTRYLKPTIIRAENLIGDLAYRTHCYDGADAIVFNSEWLRRVYRNTYGTEMEKVFIIPPAHQFDEAVLRSVPDVKNEQHIICISKWWKRPYKRFPLIARAFHHLNRNLGYSNAKLHVLGWLPDGNMPFVDLPPRLWKMPEEIRSNTNIIYYRKSFHNDTYEQVMSKAHVLIHAGVIDSGPQVVAEALSQGVPVVITNNMGGAEWVDLPEYGRVVPLDAVTESYSQINRLLPHYPSRLSRLFHAYRYMKYRKMCGRSQGYLQLAQAMREILDNYSSYRFSSAPGCTMDHICAQWIALLRDLASSVSSHGH